MKTHDFQAEREGFEPSKPFGLRAFQARALGQTMRPLHTGLEYITAIEDQQIWADFEEEAFTSNVPAEALAIIPVAPESVGQASGPARGVWTGRAEAGGAGCGWPRPRLSAGQCRPRPHPPTFRGCPLRLLAV